MFFGIKVEASTTNGAERELHSIRDYCSTSEYSEETPTGTLSTTRVTDAKCVATGTERNKFDATESPEKTVICYPGTEARLSKTYHL